MGHYMTILGEQYLSLKQVVILVGGLVRLGKITKSFKPLIKINGKKF